MICFEKVQTKKFGLRMLQMSQWNMRPCSLQRARLGRRQGPTGKLEKKAGGRRDCKTKELEKGLAAERLVEAEQDLERLSFVRFCRRT